LFINEPRPPQKKAKLSRSSGKGEIQTTQPGGKGERKPTRKRGCLYMYRDQTLFSRRHTAREKKKKKRIQFPKGKRRGPAPLNRCLSPPKNGAPSMARKSPRRQKKGLS